MKKENKKIILTVIITAIVTFSVTITAANLYNAKEMSYIPSDTTFDVNNIQDALDYLYNYNRNNINAPKSDISAITTLSNSTYKFKSGYMINNTVTKHMEINVQASVVKQNDYAYIDIDLSNKGITNVKNYSIVNNMTSGDFYVTSESVTSNKVSLKLDTNIYYNTKYDVDVTILIDYE